MEDREAKKPHGSGGYTDQYYGGRVPHGKGFVGNPIQSTLRDLCGAPSYPWALENSFRITSIATSA